jgi:hypothetical protein
MASFASSGRSSKLGIKVVSIFIAILLFGFEVFSHFFWVCLSSVLSELVFTVLSENKRTPLPPRKG